MGRLVEGTEFCLSRNAGGMLIVRPGDTVEGNYRVISAGEHSIQFEYTPLNTLQTLITDKSLTMPVRLTFLLPITLSGVLLTSWQASSLENIQHMLELGQDEAP